MRQRDFKAFRQEVWRQYAQIGRHDLPWRQPERDGSFDPYKVWLSEIMLQQTQVMRCIPIYHKMIYRYPTVLSLAEAPLSDVLKEWRGLGYNRRAKFLQQAARMVMSDFEGSFPSDTEELVKLPGVGKNTAGAVLAYAFNKPVVFVETNIRTVFIHHFFQHETGISDAAIAELVRQTLDRQNPREWYWALMDYGSYLKKSLGNPNKASKHYAKQSRFEGSRRQLRGKVLQLLGDSDKAVGFRELGRRITDDRLDSVLESLTAEGLIAWDGDAYRLGE